MSYVSTVLGDLPGTGSFWQFTEASGTLSDSGGGAHNLSVVIAPTYQQVGPLASESSFSLGFSNAGGTSVDAGDVFELTGTQSFSVEFWINPSSWATQGFIINQATAAEGWNIRILNTGVVRLQRLQASAADAVSTVTPAPTGLFSHIVFTYDGSNVNGYFNGALNVGPTASAKVIQTNAATLRVGGFSGGGSGFDGSIAFPAIYPSIVLTPTQIATHYSLAAAAGAPVRPVMMWP